MRNPVRILKALLVVGALGAMLTPAQAGTASVRVASVRVGTVTGKVTGGTAKAILMRVEYAEVVDDAFQIFPSDAGNEDFVIPPAVEYYGCIEVKTTRGTDGDCRKLVLLEPPSSLETDPAVTEGNMTFTVPTNRPEYEGRLLIANILFTGTGNPGQLQGYQAILDKDPPERAKEAFFTAFGGAVRGITVAQGSVTSQIVGGGRLRSGKGNVVQTVQGWVSLNRSKPICVPRDIQGDGEPTNDIPAAVPDSVLTCYVEFIEGMLP